MVNRLGSKLPETEAANPRSAGLDEMSSIEIVRLMNDEDGLVAPAVRKRARDIAALVDDVVGRMSGGGRLIYVGAGTSGRIAMTDAVECVPTFGVGPGRVQCIIAGGKRALTRAVEGAEDDAGQGRMEVRKRRVSSRDYVVGVTASGRTPFVLGAVGEARRLGAGTAIVTCGSLAGGGVSCDRVISVRVGPEVIAGSTRMKAGTATKLLLNTLSTAVMVRLGRVRGNLMAFVRPRSKKLWSRAVRTVAELGGVGFRRAERALERAGGDVPRALTRVAHQLSMRKQNTNDTNGRSE